MPQRDLPDRSPKPEITQPRLPRPTACRSARITSFREGEVEAWAATGAFALSGITSVQRSGTTHTRQLWSFQGQCETRAKQKCRRGRPPCSPAEVAGERAAHLSR